MNPDTFNIFTFIQNFNVLLLFKGILLFLIALYAIFAFMIYNKIRALDRIIFFPVVLPEFILKETALFYFLAIISLFFVALVIV